LKTEQRHVIKAGVQGWEYGLDHHGVSGSLRLVSFDTGQEFHIPASKEFLVLLFENDQQTLKLEVTFDSK
jgi:hypothetical protein